MCSGISRGKSFGIVLVALLSCSVMAADVGGVDNATVAPRISLWQWFRNWQKRNAERRGLVTDIRKYRRERSFITGSGGFVVSTNNERLIRDGSERDVTFDEYQRLNAEVVREDYLIPDQQALEKLMGYLVSTRYRIPVFVGASGSGKTTQLKALALNFLIDLPKEDSPYRNFLSADSTLIVTSPLTLRRLKPNPDETVQAETMLSYLRAFDETALEQQRNVVLAIEDFDSLSKGQLLAIKNFRPTSLYFKLMGTASYNGLLFLRANHTELSEHLEDVRIRELNTAEVHDLISHSWIKEFQERYGVLIPDELLPDVIAVSKEVYATKGQPTAALLFLEQLCLEKSKDSKISNEIRWADVISLSAKLTGIPFDSRNLSSVAQYIEETKAHIDLLVKGQSRLVNDVSNAWEEILTSPVGRAFRSMMILGPTGVGKSFTAEAAAHEFLGDESRVLVIDATQFQKSDSINALVGAAPGYISSDRSKGILPEFLTGAGQERGWIIINEIDKAHKAFAQRIMEMLDRGELKGGDGKTYKLNRHLVVFTSNRGANKIFSRKLGRTMQKVEMQRRIKSFAQSELKNFFIEQDHERTSEEDNAKMAPEVANRVDYWTVAGPLYRDDAREIFKRQLEAYQQQVKKDYQIRLSWDSGFVDHVMDLTYNIEDGYRPLRARLRWIEGRLKATAGRHEAEASVMHMSVVSRRGGDSFLVVRSPSRNLEEYEMKSTAEVLSIKSERFRNILNTLEADMKTEIFNQDESIAEIVKGLKSHAARPDEVAPFSIWLLGPTGNGKTEIFKVLGKYLYGSAERTRSINMGEIQTLYDFRKIFDSSEGKVGRFEEILAAFPEGGVINFDEFSNMGSGLPKSDRAALFHLFYEILEEGTWTNSSGKVYELAKYTFGMSGNDGQEHFEHLENDDMRRAVQKDLQKRSVLRDMLSKKGVPPALLNRIEVLSMTNSLDSETREKVAGKFLKGLKRQFETEYPLEIEFSKETQLLISKYFQPIKDGARGAKRFTYGEISAALADLVLKNYDELEIRKSKLKIVVTLKLLNPVEHEWAVTQKSDLVPRFELEVKGFPHQEVVTNPITDEVEGRRTLRFIAEKVAIHEAGHFVQNLLLGDPFGTASHATIESRGGYGGYVRWDPSAAIVEHGSVRNTLLRMSVYLAGRMAQEIHGYPADTGYGGRPGSSGDLDSIRKNLYRLIAEEGLLTGFDVLPLNAEGKIDLAVLSNEKRQQVEAMADSLFQEIGKITHLILGDDQVKVFTKKFADLLIEKGSVNEAQIKAFLEQTPLPEFHRWEDQINRWIEPHTKSICERFFVKEG